MSLFLKIVSPGSVNVTLNSARSAINDMASCSTLRRRGANGGRRLCLGLGSASDEGAALLLSAPGRLQPQKTSLLLNLEYMSRELTGPHTAASSLPTKQKLLDQLILVW